MAVEVNVSGPPLLTPVLATGQAEWLALYLSELGGQRVPVDVTVELGGVTMDRGRLLRGDVRVTEVDRDLRQVAALAAVRPRLTNQGPFHPRGAQVERHGVTPTRSCPGAWR